MRAGLRAMLAVSLFGPATAATAAVYQLQFSSHVTSLTDSQSVFGGATAGQGLVVTVRIDDGTTTDIRHFVDGYGSQYGVYGAVASATVRLNGVTFAFADGVGAVNRVNFLRPGFNSYDGIFTNLSSPGAAPYATTILSAGATSTTVDFLEQSPFGDFYGSPLDFTTGPSGTVSNGSFELDYIQGQPVVALFDVDRIVVSQAGAVPEPAAWSLLIAGFGLVGAVVRGRGWRGAAA